MAVELTDDPDLNSRSSRAVLGGDLAERGVREEEEEAGEGDDLLLTLLLCSSMHSLMAFIQLFLMPEVIAASTYSPLPV